MREKLAKVEKAGLSFTDRGILTANITVGYEEGLHQNICGFALDSWSPENNLHHGTEAGCEFIRRTLEVFNVDDLHLLKGVYLWVIGEGDGLSFKPLGFKPLRVDSKFRKGAVIYKDIFGKDK